jgi:hypothetical protein
MPDNQSQGEANKDDTDPDGSPEDRFEELDTPDGPGGILSDSDRRFLLSRVNFDLGPQVKWEGADEYQKMYRIRQKVKTAIHDFKFLKELDDSDLEIIFDDVAVDDPDNAATVTLDGIEDGERVYVGWGRQFNHLVAALEFFERAAEIVGPLRLDELLEVAIERRVPKHRENGPNGLPQTADVEVDVTIDVDVEWEDTYDAESILEKYREGEKLTRAEIGELFVRGEIEPGDIGADEVVFDQFKRSSFGTEGWDPLEGLDPSLPPEYQEEHWSPEDE